MISINENNNIVQEYNNIVNRKDFFWEYFEQCLNISVMYYLDHELPESHNNIQSVTNFLKKELWRQKLDYFYQNIDDFQEEKKAYLCFKAANHEIQQGAVNGILLKLKK